MCKPLHVYATEDNILDVHIAGTGCSSKQCVDIYTYGIRCTIRNSAYCYIQPFGVEFRFVFSHCPQKFFYSVLIIPPRWPPRRHFFFRYEWADLTYNSWVQMQQSAGNSGPVISGLDYPGSRIVCSMKLHFS